MGGALIDKIIENGFDGRCLGLRGALVERRAPKRKYGDFDVDALNCRRDSSTDARQAHRQGDGGGGGIYSHPAHLDSSKLRSHCPSTKDRRETKLFIE